MIERNKKYLKAQRRSQKEKYATVGSIQLISGREKMVHMNTIRSPGHVVVCGLAKKFLALYSLPLVAILTKTNSSTLFTHLSTTHPNILLPATVIPK
jgi:hypothetical protein